MIIEFSRSGGFGGASLGAVVDTDKLPADEATRLIGLARGVGPVRITRPSATSGPDRFRYVLKITTTSQDGQRSNTFRFGEGMHIDLVRYLMEIAKRRQPVSGG